jgi:hypothetical protein
MTAHISPNNTYALLDIAGEWDYSKPYEVVNKGDNWVELMVEGEMLAFKPTEVILFTDDPNDDFNKPMSTLRPDSIEWLKWPSNINPDTK